MRKTSVLIVSVLVTFGAFADIKVSDVQVFSGYPWNEVLVGYTITGNDDIPDLIRLTATDKNINKSYIVETGSRALSGAKLSEGRHVLRWNAAAEGVKFSSENVVFVVSVVSYGVSGDVQLWENGPYWAKCNLGASKPEEYGYYFDWGGTVGYKRNAANNGWISVKDGEKFSFMHYPIGGKSYSQLQSEGYIDAQGNLVANYDAATKHLGTPWRMPTDAEWEELVNNCTSTWTVKNGVHGRLVHGKGAYASKSIFLPAAGYGEYNCVYDPGSRGHYWSSTPYWFSGSLYEALHLYFCSDDFCRHFGQHFAGRTVRPVRGFAK